MNGAMTIDVLVGLGMPLVIALITQAHWAPMWKGVTAFALCVVAATVIEWVRGDIVWADWRTTVVFVLGSALFFYQSLWKPAQIAPTLEAMTTVTGPTPRQYRP